MKLSLLDFGSDFQSKQNLNANNTLIENALENTLSRDGTAPNQMLAPLDMNSNKVINSGAPVNPTDLIRLEDLQAVINPGTQLPVSSLGVRTSTLGLLTLNQMNAVVSAIGGTLIVDTLVTLTQNSAVTVPLSFDGGRISLGSFNLDGSGRATIFATDTQVFDISGSGVLTGEFWYGDYFLVSWVGVIGVNADGVGTAPFDNAAVFAAANKVILQKLENFGGQSNQNIRALFTRYITAFNGGITNPNGFSCVGYYGLGSGQTRIYIPDGTTPRTLTASSTSANSQYLYKSLGIYGKFDRTTPILINIVNWCGAKVDDVYLSLAAQAIRISSVGASQYSENVILSNISWDNDAGVPLSFVTSGGTGSFRGFQLQGFNIFAGTGANSDTFCDIGPGCQGYDWGDFNLTCTNHTLTRDFSIFANRSPANILNIANLRLDLESNASGGFFVIVANPTYGFVINAAGPPAFNGNNFKYGNYIWNCNYSAIGTSRYLQGGTYTLEQNGKKTITGNAANKDLGLLSSGSSGYYVDLLFRCAAAPASFCARVVGNVMPDSGDGFTGGCDLSIQILSNTAAVTFTNGTFSVGSDGLLKCSALFGGLVISVTGSVTLGGVS